MPDTPATAATPPAAQKPPVATKEHPFTVVGRAGTMFRINPARGVDFGEKDGMLTVGGRNIIPHSWRSDVIKGELPKDLRAGEAIITKADGTTLTAPFDAVFSD